jgi:hypothetical protein
MDNVQKNAITDYIWSSSYFTWAGVALGTGGPGLDSRQGQDIFLLFLVYTDSGSTQPPIQCVPRFISPGVKRRGRDADHSSPHSDESRISGGIPPFPIRLNGVVLNKYQGELYLLYLPALYCVTSITTVHISTIMCFYATIYFNLLLDTECILNAFEFFVMQSRITAGIHYYLNTSVFILYYSRCLFFVSSFIYLFLYFFLHPVPYSIL